LLIAHSPYLHGHRAKRSFFAAADMEVRTTDVSDIVADTLISRIRKFPLTRIAVIGDLMIDEFIYGRAGRISPEAPVPVVQVVEKKYRLGGAANVLHNIRALRGNGFICGIVGGDAMGKKFTSEIKRLGAHTGGIITERGRPTTVKTRIIADHRQQVVRYDHEDRAEASPQSRKQLLSYLAAACDGAGALIISDYAKGAVPNPLLKDVLQWAHAKKMLVCTDHPNPHNYALYKNRVTVITPNKKEAAQISGIEIENEETLIKAGRALLAKLGCEAVLITRGEDGMSLFQRKRTTHIPTKAKEVYDVTGAGDTVIATLTMALCAGASWEEAAIIANHAAGIVVSKLGTATVTPRELIESIREDPC
jgi:D-beta-D-heptose 7-phosphate kinase/D-beta-D-heptose 1-phosphate adenosyltransferase